MNLTDWINGKFEETDTDYTIAGENILYKNEIEFLPKGVELLCKKLKPKSVLEFGFGMGWTATEFQKHGVERHVILEPNKENYQMALEWKKQYDTNIEILNIFSWDYNGGETFDLIYDDREPVTKDDFRNHFTKMEEILPSNQWYSRNAGILKTNINNFYGDSFSFKLNGTTYIQHLIRGLYGNG
tara:strand:- start:317 stop:871 length:555 start_codon:yes stop_codon:yes gene_type:complete